MGNLPASVIQEREALKARILLEEDAENRFALKTALKTMDRMLDCKIASPTNSGNYRRLNN